MTIELSHDDFTTAVTDVGTAARRLAERRDRICAEVEALLGGGWRGGAAESFGSAWEEWREAATRVGDGLAAMGALLDAVHRDLTGTDAQTSDRLDAVAARICERLG